LIENSTICRSGCFFDDEELKKVVLRLPALLGLSIKGNMDPKLDYVQKRLSLDENDLKKVVMRFPQIFTLGVEGTLEPKLKYLQERLSVDEEELSYMIRRMPALFGYKIDLNLEPTIKFYEDLVGVETTKKLILGRPALVTYSLEKRLKPRLDDARNAGITIDSATLIRMGVLTNEAWAASLAYQIKQLLKSSGGLW